MDSDTQSPSTNVHKPTTLTPDESGRDALVSYLYRELVGPAQGSDELLDKDLPLNRYAMGILFPKGMVLDQIDTAEEIEDQSGSEAPDETDDPVAMAGQWMPASMGMTFLFEGIPEIVVKPSAAAYKEAGTAWQRSGLHAPEVHVRKPSAENRSRLTVLEGRAEVHVVWRPHQHGWLVTVSLVNRNQLMNNGWPEAEDCLYQAELSCRPVDGRILPYPRVDLALADNEEEELQLLYRHTPVYAIGHGCAVTWTADAQGHAVEIHTTWLPVQEVPSLTFEIPEMREYLRIPWLASSGTELKELTHGLKSFVGLYRKWVDGLLSEHSDIPPHLIPARDRLLARLHSAADRMDLGISLLATDPLVLEAFQLANLAMLMQMYHGQPSLGGSPRDRDSLGPVDPDYLEWKKSAWRPFQLAYQLLTLESVANTSSADRDTVDLIWFPTGGGKTEAYLAVAAFEIFLRRLRHGDRGGGTTVITRYTLRLLTAQQFQRSARLICACEILRRRHAPRLGQEPITVGLWAGESASPNKIAKAYDTFLDLREQMEPQNPFPLKQCPWCGTVLVPSTRADELDAYGIRAGNNTFEFYCPSVDCDFHDLLPVNIVDEILYQSPPTFLIGTVDKFARLAWVGEAHTLFGRTGVLPPSLIIQDELHLLSGPLGTVAGLYEGAIATVIELRGARPKIIASTATIRSAPDQVRGLFGRPVAQFPPPGLSAHDSFFARTTLDRPGRLYAGMMATSHRPTTSLIRLCAGLLQGVNELDFEGLLSPSEADAYWTLVVYHNSLRELGKTITFARDDIPARMKVIRSSDDTLRELNGDDVLELTSNLSAEEIPASLDRIGRPRDDEESVSLLASTNMISVGIDFPRLGLMVINGQPKTTSEYIQASSRVGRGAVPGLVITHYSSNKPRDRSHYESFIPYHMALYRYVEPTSVTSFALPARDRALHACLVIAVRHGVGLHGNTDAAKFRVSDPAIQQALAGLKATARTMDADEADATAARLDHLADEWDQLASSTTARLYYSAKQAPQLRVLLRNFDEPEDQRWPTLHSMRNVDTGCEITVRGEKS